MWPVLKCSGSHEGIYTSYYCGPTTPWFYGEEARGLGTSSGYEQMHLLHLFVNTDRAVPPGVGKEKGKEHLGSRKKGLRRKAGIWKWSKETRELWARGFGAITNSTVSAWDWDFPCLWLVQISAWPNWATVREWASSLVCLLYTHLILTQLNNLYVQFFFVNKPTIFSSLEFLMFVLFIFLQCLDYIRSQKTLKIEILQTLTCF